MRYSFATVGISCLFTFAASAGCPPSNHVSDARIGVFGCNVQNLAKLQIQIAKKNGNGNEAPLTARKISDAPPDGAYFEINDLPYRVDAENYEIAIVRGPGVLPCCQSAKELPLPEPSRDCYVQFTVACDKPEWGFNVVSDSPLTFEYERQHSSGFKNAYFCKSTASLGSSSANGFGAGDMVRLFIRRNNDILWDYTIPVSELLEKATIPIDARKFAVRGTTNSSSQPGTHNSVDLVRLQLPKSITLAKK